MSAVSTIARIKGDASNRDFFQLGNSSNNVNKVFNLISDISSFLAGYVFYGKYDAVK